MGPPKVEPLSLPSPRRGSPRSRSCHAPYSSCRAPYSSCPRSRRAARPRTRRAAPRTRSRAPNSFRAVPAGGARASRGRMAAVRVHPLDTPASRSAAEQIDDLDPVRRRSRVPNGRIAPISRARPPPRISVQRRLHGEVARSTQRPEPPAVPGSRQCPLHAQRLQPALAACGSTLRWPKWRGGRWRFPAGPRGGKGVRRRLDTSRSLLRQQVKEQHDDTDARPDDGKPQHLPVADQEEDQSGHGPDYGPPDAQCAQSPPVPAALRFRLLSVGSHVRNLPLAGLSASAPSCPVALARSGSSSSGRSAREPARGAIGRTRSPHVASFSSAGPCSTWAASRPARMRHRSAACWTMRRSSTSTSRRTSAASPSTGSGPPSPLLPPTGSSATTRPNTVSTTGSCRGVARPSRGCTRVWPPRASSRPTVP